MFENRVLLGTNNGRVKYVEIYTDFVVAYMSKTRVDYVKNLQEQAGKMQIDSHLAQIFHTGENFIVFEKCQSVCLRTIPANYKHDLIQLKRFIELDYRDFRLDNIMVCGDTLKIIDQDPPLHPSLHHATRCFNRLDLDINSIAEELEQTRLE